MPLGMQQPIYLLWQLTLGIKLSIRSSKTKKESKGS